MNTYFIFAIGSVLNAKHTGRKRSARSEANINQVRADTQARPNVSLSKRSTQLELSKTSLWRILKKDLSLFRYKIQITQHLKDTDPPLRLRYAQSVANKVTQDPNFWQKIVMSDEAQFTLYGSVNRQNIRFWAAENPCVIHQQPLYDKKVTVWCGICSEKIIGPYFFEDENGTTVTVNGDRYRDMLTNFVKPQIDALGIEGLWFQQDGAPWHTANLSINILNRMFPGHVISKRGDIEWPPRSPDLTPPDFFL